MLLYIFTIDTWTAVFSLPWSAFIPLTYLNKHLHEKKEGQSAKWNKMTYKTVYKISIESMRR